MLSFFDPVIEFFRQIWFQITALGDSFSALYRPYIDQASWVANEGIMAFWVLLIFCAVAMIGYQTVKIRRRLEMIEGIGNKKAYRLAEQVELLQLEVAALHEEMGAVQSRVVGFRKAANS